MTTGEWVINNDPIEVYFDWVNNYITISHMAKDYGVSVCKLKAAITKGKLIHDRKFDRG